MLKGVDVARYFLGLDKEQKVFNKEVLMKNGREFYEGNARLNKYLHMAQNIYIAKYGKPLMDSIFYAYDNGAVDPNVQEKYSILLNMRNNPVFIGKDEKEYLDNIYKAFKNASLDELIELSPEDLEWIDKHGYDRKEDQIMDSMTRQKEYAEQYVDMIKVLDRMGA